MSLHHFSDRSSAAGPGSRASARQLALTRLLTFLRFLPLLAQFAMVGIAWWAGNIPFLVMSIANAALSLTSVLTEIIRKKDTATASEEQPSHTHEPQVEDEKTWIHHQVELLATAPSNANGHTSVFAASQPFTSFMPALLTSPDWRSILRYWLRDSSFLPDGSVQLTSAVDLRVPLGSTLLYPTAQIDELTVDLGLHGPHVLIAGTTGSGKSVLLQCWCASLALCNSPQRVQFIFLDFKGGATFNDFKHLPHARGCVSDLSIAHAKRALRAIEEELHRREQLVAQHHVSQITQLSAPPAHLIIVVDEFTALKNQLPDYVQRLTRIASQGRSLGMHLILATQSPLGQLSTDMRANLSLLVCLRLRDNMQSTDLVGVPDAAHLPSIPGLGIVEYGQGPQLFHAPHLDSCAALVHHCSIAAKFVETAPAQELFSAPLPRIIPWSASSTSLGLAPTSLIEPAPSLDLPTAERASKLALGLQDSGTALLPAFVDLTHGNIAIVGGHGRGKTNLLTLLRTQYEEACSSRENREINTAGESSAFTVRWRDDADHLLDPANSDAVIIREELSNPKLRTVMCLTSAKYVRRAEHFATVIYFPTGEPTSDALAGLSRPAVQEWEAADYTCPGRAVLMTGAQQLTIQCYRMSETARSGTLHLPPQFSETPKNDSGNEMPSSLPLESLKSNNDSAQCSAQFRCAPHSEPHAMSP